MIPPLSLPGVVPLRMGYPRDAEGAEIAFASLLEVLNRQTNKERQPVAAAEATVTAGPVCPDGPPPVAQLRPESHLPDATAAKPEVTGSESHDDSTPAYAQRRVGASSEAPDFDVQVTEEISNLPPMAYVDFVHTSQPAGPEPVDATDPTAAEEATEDSPFETPPASGALKRSSHENLPHVAKPAPSASLPDDASPPLLVRADAEARTGQAIPRHLPPDLPEPQQVATRSLQDAASEAGSTQPVKPCLPLKTPSKDVPRALPLLLKHLISLKENLPQLRLTLREVPEKLEGSAPPADGLTQQANTLFDSVAPDELAKKDGTAHQNLQEPAAEPDILRIPSLPDRTHSDARDVILPDSPPRPHRQLALPHLSPALASPDGAISPQTELDDTGGGKGIMLSLAPEELGRLKLTLHSEGDRILAQIRAEQPDTLELLRRNGEQLLAEFRAAGFRQAEMQFGHWTQDQPNARSDHPANQPGVSHPVVSEPESAAPPALRRSPGKGLDLRL